MENSGSSIGLRRSHPTAYTSPTSTPPASYDSFPPPQHPLDTQNFGAPQFPASTFIELSDLSAGGNETSFESEPVMIGSSNQNAPLGGGAGEMRSRSTVNPDAFSDPSRVPRQPRTDPRRSHRQEFVNEDENKKSHRPGRRAQEEEPLIDELLAVLPPEISAFLVKVGRIVYPSLQLLNVRTDLEETSEVFVFNKQPQHFLKNFTSGLSFHAVALLVSFVVFIMTELAVPEFFDYPYFFFSPGEIFTYWKFFIWGGALASLVWYLKGGRVPKVDQKAFVMKAANGMLLAIIEEFGYRWLYICLTMVVVKLFNVFIHHVATWLGLGVCIASVGILIFAGIGYAGGFAKQASIQRFFAKYNPVYIMMACVVGLLSGIFLIAMGLVYTVIFDTIWDYVIVPACNLFSGWQFDDMFNGWFNGIEPPPDARRWRSRNRKEFWKNAADHKFFIYGMILSNLTYRDGHKYQGLVGWINSWYVGLVLLSAMVHYGFFTALAIHLLYELEFIAVGWVFRRFQLARPTRNPATSAIPM